MKESISYVFNYEPLDLWTSEPVNKSAMPVNTWVRKQWTVNWANQWYQWPPELGNSVPVNQSVIEHLKYEPVDLWTSDSEPVNSVNIWARNQWTCEPENPSIGECLS